MMEWENSSIKWKSTKQQHTAKSILKILSQTRANKTAIKNYLNQIKEEKEDIEIYESDKDIEETIKLLLEQDFVVRSSDGHFFERKDVEVVS